MENVNLTRPCDSCGKFIGGGTAPSEQDYAMQTLIAHGSSSGQMTYGSVGVGGATAAGANTDMAIIRTIGNSSGGSITIREVGLAGAYWISSGCYFLFAHDVVNQAVANGETAIVIYTMRTTV